MAFEGAVADVLAFHAGHGREHGEHDAGRVVRALQLPGEELQADVARLQFLGEHGEFDAAAEPLVLVDDKGRGDSGGADLPGELHGGIQLGAPGGAGGDLLREDPGHAGFGDGVKLCVERLVGGGGAGVAEADVPDRFGADAHRPGQLGPHRPRLAYGGGRHAERLGELGHEAEAGGVVLDGHLALAGAAAGGARGGGTGGHRDAGAAPGRGRSRLTTG